MGLVRLKLRHARQWHDQASLQVGTFRLGIGQPLPDGEGLAERVQCGADVSVLVQQIAEAFVGNAQIALVIGTLGLGFLLAFLTRLVVNAILLKLVDAVSDNLSIDGFGWAFIGAACISVLSGLADYLLRML